MERVGSSQQHVEDAGWLVKSVERMFRPMVRLLVGRVSCNVLVDLIKQMFVQEARRELRSQDPDRRITKSALALITGLDTRAITALEDSSHEYSIVDLSPEAAVLAVWASDAMFRDEQTGEPRVLPIYGRGLTFQNLVTRTVGRNVTCPTVLEKLTESGNIEVVDDNFVRLKERFYKPVRDSVRTVLETGSLAINRLASTIDHNLSCDGSSEQKWIQQDRWTRKLSPSRAAALRAEMRTLLERHIAEAEECIEPFEEPVRTENHSSAGVGWYYWEDTPDQNSSTSNRT